MEEKKYLFLLHILATIVLSIGALLVANIGFLPEITMLLGIGALLELGTWAGLIVAGW